MNHIAICSLLFDHKPEGLCTGRLVRCLLQSGVRVTLITSDKAKLGLQHPLLHTRVFASGPREPKAAIRLLARWRGHIESNFYFWSRRVRECPLDAEALPQVIYARAWPHASLVAGYELAQQWDLPLWLHFSDPFPPPNEPPAKAAFMRSLVNMVQRAERVSLTNAATLAYQQQHLPEIADKACILPHVAPQLPPLTAPPQAQVFGYFGALGPSRPADALLAGFARYHRAQPQARLRFVGTNVEYLQPLLRQYALESVAEILPFTSDVATAMQAVEVLVSFDNALDNPIYTPTKIVDYLMASRKILALTPAQSPVDELMTQHPQTCVAVHDYQPTSVAEGLAQVASLVVDESYFQARRQAMRAFDGEHIARTLCSWLPAPEQG